MTASAAPPEVSWLAPVVDPLAYVQALAADRLPDEENLPANQLLRRLGLLLAQRLKQANLGVNPTPTWGQGLDFSNLREYVPGDDLRKIDWNVFARTFTPHVKEFEEEQQLTIWLVVDLTPSMFFGSWRSKARQAVQLAMLLGVLNQEAGNKVGLLCFDGQGHHILPPRTGRSSLEALSHKLLSQLERPASFAPCDAETVFSRALAALFPLTRQAYAATVFVLSDFLGWGKELETQLMALARQTHLSCFWLVDPRESVGLVGVAPTADGVLSVFDPETGMPGWLTPQNQAACQEKALAVQAKIQTSLRRMGSWVSASTQEDPVEITVQWLKRLRSVATVARP